MALPKYATLASVIMLATMVSVGGCSSADTAAGGAEGVEGTSDTAGAEPAAGQVTA